MLSMGRILILHYSGGNPRIKVWCVSLYHRYPTCHPTQQGVSLCPLRPPRGLHLALFGLFMRSGLTRYSPGCLELTTDLHQSPECCSSRGAPLSLASHWDVGVVKAMPALHCYN